MRLILPSTLAQEELVASHFVLKLLWKYYDHAFRYPIYWLGFSLVIPIGIGVHILMQFSIPGAPLQASIVAAGFLAGVYVTLLGWSCIENEVVNAIRNNERL